MSRAAQLVRTRSTKDSKVLWRPDFIIVQGCGLGQGWPGCTLPEAALASPGRAGGADRALITPGAGTQAQRRRFPEASLAGAWQEALGAAVRVWKCQAGALTQQHVPNTSRRGEAGTASGSPRAHASNPPGDTTSSTSTSSSPVVAGQHPCVTDCTSEAQQGQGLTQPGLGTASPAPSGLLSCLQACTSLAPIPVPVQGLSDTKGVVVSSSQDLLGTAILGMDGRSFQHSKDRPPGDIQGPEIPMGKGLAPAEAPLQAGFDGG